MKQTIPIFFTFDRYYVLAACVAFDSLLDKASKAYFYRLYVVHTGLDEKSKRRLRRVVERYKANASLEFVVAPGYDTGWTALSHKAHFSKEVFYKMTAANLFPQYDRILFSDVDVIFTADISSSYFLYPDEKFYFAGTRPLMENRNLPGYAKDFTQEEIDLINTYEISAGYMLINLKAIREDGIEAKLVRFFQRNAARLILPEQDCIALCCYPFLKFMDYKYVVCNSQFGLNTADIAFNTNNPFLKDRKEAIRIYHKMLAECVQLHYPGADKPWNNPRVLKFKEWWKACGHARMRGVYFREQFLFLRQRMKRYDLSRFIGKLRRKFKA